MLVKKLLLEAVTVCVNYADFLEETIPYNLPQIDLWTIVTTPEDTQTQNVCTRYGLRCLKTDCFYRDVDPPANQQESRHQLRAWPITRIPAGCSTSTATSCCRRSSGRMIENAELDPASLYGIDRVDCLGSDAWDAFRHEPELQYEWSCLVKPPQGMAARRTDFPRRLRRVLPPGLCSVVEPEGARGSIATRSWSRGTWSTPTCSLRSSGRGAGDTCFPKASASTWNRPRVRGELARPEVAAVPGKAHVRSRPQTRDLLTREGPRQITNGHGRGPEPRPCPSGITTWSWPQRSGSELPALAVLGMDVLVGLGAVGGLHVRRRPTRSACRSGRRRRRAGPSRSAGPSSRSWSRRGGRGPCRPRGSPSWWPGERGRVGSGFLKSANSFLGSRTCFPP